MVSQCQIVGNIKKWIVADVNASLESENGSGYSGGGVMWRWFDGKNNELTHNNQNQDFFPRPNSPKPKPGLFFWDQIFRNRNQDFFSETKFSETETETLNKMAKVSKPRSFETEMSISTY